MQSKQAAVLQGWTWQCFNYFAASTGKVTARGKSTTRGSCQLPCLYKWFHERSAECVCLCRVFTDPNERMAKKKKRKKKGSYSLSHNLQWRWSKVKVAWLRSYCTYTLDYKLSPPVTSIAPLRNQHDVKKKKNNMTKRKKEKTEGKKRGSWFCPLAKWRGFNFLKDISVPVRNKKSVFQAWSQGAPQPDLSQVRVQGATARTASFGGLFCEILIGEEFLFAVHDDTVAGVPQAPGEPH